LNPTKERQLNLGLPWQIPFTAVGHGQVRWPDFRIDRGNEGGVKPPQCKTPPCSFDTHAAQLAD
jgi:hypothetical protein